MEISKNNCIMFLTFLVCIAAVAGQDNSTFYNMTTTNGTITPIPTDSSGTTTPLTTNGTTYKATTDIPTSSVFSLNITNTTNVTIIESTTSSTITTSTPSLTTVTDYCASSPCKHGNCQQGTNRYVCECFIGWSGTNCDNVSVLWPDYKNDALGIANSSFSPHIKIPFSYFETRTTTLICYSDGYVAFGAQFQESNAPIGTVWPNIPPLFGIYWAKTVFQSNDSIFYFKEYYFLKHNTSKSPLVQYVQSIVNESNFEPLFIGVLTYINASSTYKDADSANSDIATFQLILATDSQFSYAIKNYQMVWKNLDTSDRPTFSVMYTGANGTHLPGETPRDLTGNITQKLFSNGTPNKDPYFCVSNVSDVNDRLGVAIRSLPDCPCYLAQARSDWWFELPNVINVTTTCYQSTWPDSNGLKQLCCYNRFGLLIRNSSEANVPVQINATGITLQAAYNQCCKVATQLCPWFYNQFPTSNCNKYSPPSIGGIFGMMHFLTFDSNKYTCFSVGDFVLFRSGSVEIQIRAKINGNNKTTSLEAIAAKVSENTSSFQFYLQGSELKVDKPDNQSYSPNSYKIDQSPLEITLFHTTFILTVTTSSGVLSCTLRINKENPNSVGLLGSADKNQANDFKFRNASVAQGTADKLSQEMIIAFVQSWQVNETESLVSYSSARPHGEDNNSTGFTPLQLSNNVTETLSMFTDANKKNASQELCHDELFCLQEYLFDSNASAIIVLEQMMNISSQKDQFSITAPNFTGMPPNIRINPDSYLYTLPLGVMNNMAVSFSFTMKGFPDINATIEGSKFTWNIMTDLAKLRSLTYPRELKFYATNTENISTEYTPLINICLCNKTEQCTESTFPDEVNNGNLNNILCSCGDRYGGKFCEEVTDVCKNCFNKSACNETLDDYCGPCPDGFGGNGKICRDINECLNNNSGCEHSCNNTVGSFQCFCRSGYSQNGSKCMDKNECLDVNICQNELKFCTNLPGSYSCACFPGLVGQEKCIKAPYAFVGSINLAISDGQSWSQDYLNKISENYKTLSGNVSKSITSALIAGGIGTNETLYVEILSFKNPHNNSRRKRQTSGQFEVEFVIHSSNSTTTPDDVNNAFTSYMPPSCNSSCRFGDIIVSAAPSVEVNDTLCNYPDIHKCDNTSTKCVQEKSSTSCECRSGFTLSSNPFYCYDIDECAENATKICPDTGVCMNTQGTYMCECSDGKFWNASSAMCVANGCSTNPCKNDGVCYVLVDRDNFACKCGYGWEGHLCENEDEEANRMKIAVICVSTILGACCLILFIILIVICIRQRRTLESDSYTYTNSRYSEAGHLPRAKIAQRPGTEMTENGQGTGYERLNASRPDDKQVSFGHHAPTPGGRTDVNHSVYHNDAYEADFGERL